VSELTDKFLSDIARAYAAAVARREPPNKTIAADAAVPIRTVERWVYTARKRGIMAPTRKGSRGFPGKTQREIQQLEADLAIAVHEALEARARLAGHYCGGRDKA
jgi:transposase